MRWWLRCKHKVRRQGGTYPLSHLYGHLAPVRVLRTIAMVRILETQSDLAPLSGNSWRPNSVGGEQSVNPAQNRTIDKVKNKRRPQRWPRNFEQGVKWKLGLTGGMFCLRIRSEDEEASPPESHTGL